MEQQPQYSTSLPTHLRELLKYQAQIPYNIIANQVAYRGPDKPYVPHRVEQPIQQQPIQPQPIQPKPIQPQQLRPIQQAQYQNQGGAYQAQASAYTQARLAGYNPNQLGYNPNQLSYNQQQPGVRPVTENNQY